MFRDLKKKDWIKLTIVLIVFTSFFVFGIWAVANNFTAESLGLSKLSRGGVVSAGSVEEETPIERLSYQTNKYDLGNGKFAQTSSLGFVNYKDGEDFKPINKTIVVSSDTLYDYEVTKGIYHSYFKENPTEGQVVKFVIGSEYITYQPMALNYRNDLSQLQQINMIQNVVGVPDGNEFLYEDAYGSGIDLQYSYWNDYLREELIISSSSDLISPEQYIIDGENPTLDLDFILTTNSNKIVIDGIEWDKSSEIETSDEVFIKDELGNVIYYLKKPYAYDSNNSIQLLTYNFRKVGQDLFVTIKTPYSWLSNESRVYPIHIDPDTGAISSGTMADDDTVGTATWIDPDNAKASDNNDAKIGLGPNFETIIEYSIKLVKSNVISGDDKSAGLTIPGSDTYVNYGGAEELWGLEWDWTDINADDFGVVFSSEISGGGISHYLKATNFGFSIPEGATINGILVEIEEDQGIDGPSIYIYIDHIRITVYYSEAVEEIPPTYSNVAHNTTLAGQLANFSIDYDDDTALHPDGQWVFSTNNTGEWVNDTVCGGTLDCFNYKTEASCENCSQCNWTVVEENTDYTDNDCDTVFGMDCSSTSAEGDNTFDDCSTGSNSNLMHIINSVVNSTIIGVGDSIQLTCQIDCYSTGSEIYAYHKKPGGSWVQLWADNCNSGNEENWEHTITDATELGEHQLRCIVDWDGENDECASSGSYYDNDDVNFSVSARSFCSNDGECSSCSIDECDTNCSDAGCSEGGINFIATPQTISTVKTLNTTVGLTIAYRWFATDNVGNVNNTEIFYLTTTSADTCTCAGLNENWEINHSDACVIVDACDLGTGTLSFTGVGTTQCDAQIDTTNLGDPGSSGILEILDDCLIYVS